MRKKVEIQKKGEQLMINLIEAKLMNEENWIDTTKMRKNLEKPLQETIEEEWKSETQEKGRKKRVGKEELRKKVKIILLIVIKHKCGKTRRELNGIMPHNIYYIGLLIYINDIHVQWRITLIKICYYCKVRCSFIVGNMSPWKKTLNMCGVRTLTSFADLSSYSQYANRGNLCNQGMKKQISGLQLNTWWTWSRRYLRLYS